MSLQRPAFYINKSYSTYWSYTSYLRSRSFCFSVVFPEFG